MLKSPHTTILFLVIGTICALSGASCAGLIFSEEFNGLPGADISTLGWTHFGGGNSPAMISSQTIDTGNSAIQSSTAGRSMYIKHLPIPYTLGLDEIVSLTWVARTPRNPAVPSQSSCTVASIWGDNTLWRIWTYGQDGRFYWYSDYLGAHDTRGVCPLPTGMTDVVHMRMDISRTTSAFFYRNQGATEWKLISDNDIGPVTIKAVDIIMGEGADGFLPQMDSIRMTSLPSPGDLSKPGNLAGHVELRDYSGSTDLIPIVIDLLQDGVSVYQAKVYLDAAGGYLLEGIPPGVYDVAFSAVEFVREVVTGVVIPSNGSTATCNVSLRNGDVDGDGVVSPTDAGIVKNNLDLEADR